MGNPGGPDTGRDQTEDPVYGDILSYLMRYGENRPVKARQISTFVRVREAMRQGVPVPEVNLLDLHQEVTRKYLCRLDELGLIDYSLRQGVVLLEAPSVSLDPRRGNDPRSKPTG